MCHGSYKDSKYCRDTHKLCVSSFTNSYGLAASAVTGVGQKISQCATIVAACTVASFAAVPGGGMPLMVLLMSFSYAAMRISPIHVCLTIAVEHMGSSFGALAKKAVLPILIFCVVIIGYYLLLTLL